MQAGMVIGASHELDVADWRRHRWGRLVVACAAVALSLLVPTRDRSVLAAAALGGYLPVALVVGLRTRPPRPLGAVWWAVVVADCLALAVVLAVVPEAEPLALLGFLLVVVVNATAFGIRAGIAAAVTAAAAATAGHLSDVHRLTDLAVDVGAFALVVGLVVFLVGRQAEDLRSHRARLEQALADLRRVDELRSRLVSTLARDLRSPLGAIQSAVNALLQPHEGVSWEVQADLLQGMERQADRRVRLATGLLDLARLEEGILELEVRQVRVADAIEDSLGFVDPEGMIEVEVDPGLWVSADPERLDQILVNLATNTLRHGAPPFVVAATVDDGWVAVAFRDCGPGVPDDEVGSLFEPFHRGHTAGSVGLGLWIVRMLVEAHGGRVAYERGVPTGACFRISLPGGATGDGSPPDPAPAGATIRDRGNGGS